MEKRLPLALMLCVAVFYWYTSTVLPQPGTEGAPGGETVVSDTLPDTGLSAPTGAALPASPNAGSPAEPMPTAMLPVESQALPFEGNGFSAVVETRGAGISRLDLDDYTLSGDDSEPMRLIGAVDPERLGFTLTASGDRYALDRVAWEIESQEVTRDGTQLVLTHTTEDGLRFTRELRSTGAPFSFDLLLRVENIGDVEGGILNLTMLGPPGVLNDTTAAFVQGPTAIAIVDERGTTEVETWKGGDLLDGTARRLAPDQRLICAGTMTNYFASLLVPHESHEFVVQPVPVLDHYELEKAVDEKLPFDEAERERWRRQLADDYRDSNASVLLSFPHTRPKPGESLEYGFTVYAGPKDRKLADEPGFGFLKSVVSEAYGSMAWINRAMLAVLEFFHGLTGNWGVAIILLTVLVRGILFPLSRVQQSQMMGHSAKMQRLKPKIDALKEKYKGNQKKFNEAQIQLMKEEGVRPPLGGCLLMLLQFPIWIGLYQVLRASIELRQAPFMGWITDLSQPDRMPLGLFGFETLNVLPILMAGAMVLSMKAQPKPADDTQAQQQKIMATIFPVMMLFLLYGYPAGLALYILTSSLLGVFEIQVIRKKWPVGDAAPTPAAT